MDNSRRSIKNQTASKLVGLGRGSINPLRTSAAPQMSFYTGQSFSEARRSMTCSASDG